jgi:hypothetical protein
MHSTSILDRSRLAAPFVLIAAVLVAACSPAASPTPSATAEPTPTVAPTATTAPTPSAEPSTAVAPSASAVINDPTADLAIAAPYQLVALDPASEALLRQQITGSLGSLGAIMDIGVRQVTDGGTLAGYAMIMGFPTGVLSETAYKAALGGLAQSLGVTFKTTDVSGTTVSSAASATAGYAAYQDGDDLVLVITPPGAGDPDAIAKALVTANK